MPSNDKERVKFGFIVDDFSMGSGALTDTPQSLQRIEQEFAQGKGARAIVACQRRLAVGNWRGIDARKGTNMRLMNWVALADANVIRRPGRDPGPRSRPFTKLAKPFQFVRVME